MPPKPKPKLCIVRGIPCPSCGRDRLERLDPGEYRCAFCKHIWKE